MNKTKKTIVFIFLITTIAGIIAFTKLAGIKVEISNVEKDTLKRYFTQEGVVKSKVEKNIYPTYSGKIKEIFVTKGQRVSEGELIAVLDSKELDYSLDGLEAEVKSLEGEAEITYQTPSLNEMQKYKLSIEQAQIKVNENKKNYQKAEELYSKLAVAKDVLDEAKNMLEMSKINLMLQQNALALLEESYQPNLGQEKVLQGRKDAVRSQIQLLEYQKEKHNIYAPQDGVIKAVNLKEGDFAGYQSPTITMFDSENYEIISGVLTKDIHDIYLGMDVKLIYKTRDDNVSFKGTIKNISPYAKKSFSSLGLEEKRVEVFIEPTIPEDLTLGPGYEVNVKFVTGIAKNRITIPKASVFKNEGNKSVFVIEGNRANIRAIKTGLETRTKVVVKEGLEQGEKIILHSSLDDVKEGIRVKF